MKVKKDKGIGVVVEKARALAFWRETKPRHSYCEPFQIYTKSLCRLLFSTDFSAALLAVNRETHK